MSMRSSSSAIDSSAASITVQAEALAPCKPHDLECRIQRGLQSYPGLRFARLTVHQCSQGVCLEGVLDENDTGLDLCEVVNRIAGVNAINHVVSKISKPK